MTIRERAVGEIDFDLLVERFDSRGGFPMLDPLNPKERLETKGFSEPRVLAHDVL
jgi:hypothetical protein